MVFALDGAEMKLNSTLMFFSLSDTFLMHGKLSVNKVIQNQSHNSFKRIFSILDEFTRKYMTYLKFWDNLTGWQGFEKRELEN